MLEDAIASIETRLAALGGALRDRDAAGVETHAQALHGALVAAIQRFAHAARQPEGVPPAMRQRLAAASGQVAAQRESLARATAALDRAIDVLMPDRLAAGPYVRAGNARQAASPGISA